MERVSRRFIIAIGIAMSLFGLTRGLHAQQLSFATKPISIVVPFPAGGGVDLVARIVANGMAPQMGQAVVVHNRSGAGGHIGAAAVAKSAADGYTLLVAPTTTLALGPVLFADPGYSASKDLVAVAILVTLPQILMVREDSSHKTFQEVMEFARGNPGKLTVGTCGKGCGQHLAVQFLMKLGNVQFHHIPFRGTADAMSAVLGGQIDMALLDPSSLSLVRGGKLRAIAVTTEKRASALPDTPAIGELVKDYEAATHFAMLAPTGTPAQVIAQLNAAVAKTLRDPSVQARLANEAMMPYADSAAYASQFVRDQAEKWQKFVVESGLVEKQ